MLTLALLWIDCRTWFAMYLFRVSQRIIDTNVRMLDAIREA